MPVERGFSKVSGAIRFLKEEDGKKTFYNLILGEAYVVPKRGITLSSSPSVTEGNNFNISGAIKNPDLLNSDPDSRFVKISVFDENDDLVGNKHYVYVDNKGKYSFDLPTGSLNTSNEDYTFHYKVEVCISYENLSGNKKVPNDIQTEYSKTSLFKVTENPKKDDDNGGEGNDTPTDDGPGQGQ